jgi:hemoglobin
MTLRQLSIYDQVGGEETFVRLADVFYGFVDADPEIRHLFPGDLTGAKDRLALFLIQYFGGPTTYSERRGHPRLRMRHAPFSIGWAERNRWVANMRRAIDSVGIAEPARGQMIDYFERGATFMINRPDEMPGL